MADHTDKTVNITAQCLCKAHTFTTDVPESKLPLDASFCHCTSCRHCTGALYAADASWPEPITAIQKAALSRFVFSPKVDLYFCNVCGTPMFWEGRYSGPEGPISTGVFTGTLANIVHPHLLRFTDHIYIGDTVDGGAALWLRSLNPDGAPVRLWAAGRAGAELDVSGWITSPSPPTRPQPSTVADGTSVPIRCKCRGVDFVLRPNFPVGADLPWFVEPESKKLLASFDGCDSCRLASGSDVFNWTFAPLEHISFADGDASSEFGFPKTAKELKEAMTGPKKDARLGSLAMYESSKDVQRYFCGKCSATVFYACDDRQDMVDVAIGLLESPDGTARVEGMLEWALGQKVGYGEDAAGGWREALFKAVEKDAEEFRVGSDRPVHWRRRIREAAEDTEQ